MDALLRAFQNDDTLVRQIAIEGATELGPRASSAFAPLREIMERESSSGIRRLATVALPAIDPGGSISVPALLTALRDPDESVRLAAIQCLGRLGPLAAPAVPVIRKDLEQLSGFGLSDQSSYKSEINDEITALGDIGVCTPEVMTALVGLFRKHPRDNWVRIEVLRTLGKFGTRAHDGLQTIRQALDDPEPSVRSAAVEALGLVSEPSSALVVELSRALGDDDSGIRSVALTALGRLGTVAVDAVPGMILALKDNDFRVQQAAIEALAQMGPTAREAIPAPRGADARLREDPSATYRPEEEALKKIRANP